MNLDMSNIKLGGKCRNPLKIIANAEIHSNSQNYIIVILVAIPPCSENTVNFGARCCIQNGSDVRQKLLVVVPSLLYSTRTLGPVPFWEVGQE